MGKKKPAKKKQKAKLHQRAKPAEKPAENPRMPLCRICNHRHSGVEHIWA